MTVQSEERGRRRGREINVRDHLCRDVRRILYIAVWVTAWFGVQGTRAHFSSRGADAHCYWLAWRGPMYTTGPMTKDAYLYSPAFAQAIWPVALIPWFTVFAVIAMTINTALFIWLLRPLGWRWTAPIMLTLSAEILDGNIYTTLAAMCVLGFRYPGVWAFSALTKVAPTVIPVWWLVRREWRPLAVWLGTTLAIVVLSAALAPDLWVQWVEHLVAWARDSGHRPGTTVMVPVLYRAPIGVALLVVGARRDWRWTVPVAALLCTPVYWLGSFAWLAALPRIQGGQSEAFRPGRQVPTVAASTRATPTA